MMRFPALRRFAPGLLLLLLFACLSPVFAGDAKDADDNNEDEALVLNLAARWKLANQRWVKNEHVVQYLPDGANQNNPAELLTVTTITGVADTQTAKTYILQIKQAIESAKEKAVLNWRLVKDSASDASCEYTLSGHAKVPDQHELMRVIRGTAELHSIIFHFGKLNPSPQEKERAWEIVNGVKLMPASQASEH